MPDATKHPAEKGSFIVISGRGRETRFVASPIGYSYKGNGYWVKDRAPSPEMTSSPDMAYGFSIGAARRVLASMPTARIHDGRQTLLL